VGLSHKIENHSFVILEKGALSIANY